MKLSVVISTRNRAQSLERTLRSVQGLADEIVVIDNESTDPTPDVAKRLGAKVYTRPNNLMLNLNKNYGFTKATGDMILGLDDDEEIPPELAREIKDKLRHPDPAVDGYWIARRNIIFGKWIEHGLWWPDRQLRLFKKGRGVYKESHVHEYIDVIGKTDVLVAPFIHHNYDTLSQYLEKMQVIYTESEVQKFRHLGYRVQWSDAIRFPLSDFLKIYFAQRGYKDGLHGLVLALLQAFYSFIIFVKLWEKEKFREERVPFAAIRGELVSAKHDIVYWVRSAQMQEATHPILRFYHRVLRKLGR